MFTKTVLVCLSTITTINLLRKMWKSSSSTFLIWHFFPADALLSVAPLRLHLFPVTFQPRFLIPTLTVLIFFPDIYCISNRFCSSIYAKKEKQTHI